jgi:hypothetical protein
MWKTISISMPISINDHEVSEITHRQDLAARGDRGNRAAHQVSLADEQGRFIWTGRRFHLADGTELKAVSGSMTAPGSQWHHAGAAAAEPGRQWHPRVAGRP